jgi:HEAT repeat protein
MKPARFIFHLHPAIVGDPPFARPGLSRSAALASSSEGRLVEPDEKIVIDRTPRLTAPEIPAKRLSPHRAQRHTFDSSPALRADDGRARRARECSSLQIPWLIAVVLVVLTPGQEPAATAQPQTGAARQRPSATQPMASQPTGTLPASPALSAADLDELLGLVTGNNTPEARKLGAKKLLESPTSDGADRLALVLKVSPPDAAAQLAVCQAIASSEHPPASLIDPLLSLLGAQQLELGGPISNALRRFDPGMVLERLQPLARDESVAMETRLSATAALGAMGDDIRAVAALVEQTGDKNKQIRVAALSALAQAAGVELTDAAAAASWWKQRQAFTQADWTGEVQARRLAENRKLQADRQLLTARLTTAYRELYLHTPEADRPRKLLSFLMDELPEVREAGLALVNAAITDRKNVSSEVKARLIEMISDPYPGLRLKVAQIIGDLRLANAVSRLIEAVSMEGDHRARAALVDALGRLGGAQAVPALIERLNDDVPSVAAHAAAALASIARSSAPEDRTNIENIASAIADRFAMIPATDDDLREKFLDAMTRIGTESFRPIFKAEMAGDRSVRIRRAAISGLAAFTDLATADDVLPLISAAEPEIRLAAVTALGKCGRRETDLTTLSGRLDAKSESDPPVRQRAWESYLAIADRLPPQDHLRVAEQFAKPDDKIAQRQRLELLSALQTSSLRFEQLKSKNSDKRLDLLEAMADAHMKLGEFAPAAACLTQAADLAQGAANGRFAALAARSVAVLLVGHEDEAAVQRIKDLLNPEGQEASPDKAILAQTVLDELKARVEAVVDAATYTDAARLLDSLSALSQKFGNDFETRLTSFREAAQASRASAVDALLNAAGVDAQAEAKLQGFSADVVLMRIHARLTDPAPTSAPSPAAEERLVQFARRIAPDWPGYSLDDSASKRTAALNALAAAADAAAAAAPRAPAVPASAPGANRPASVTR